MTKWIGLFLIAAASSFIIKAQFVAPTTVAVNPIETGLETLVLNDIAPIEAAPVAKKVETVAAAPAPVAKKVVAPVVPKERHMTVSIKSGDTLGKIFEREGLDSALLHEITTHKDVSDTLTKFYPGQELDFHIDAKNNLQSLAYNVGELERLTVKVKDGKPAIDIIERDLEELITFANATIDDSLFMAAEREGLDYNITMELARIFGWDIDFALDIQKGDQFSVIYEARYVDGEKVTPGNIIAAEFVNHGKTHRAIRYEDADGNADYYTPEGHRMHKAFLRAPLEFARVSSKFNPNRRHPILHTIRAHKGVDYAAAIGTPVRATGDGVISIANTQRGYGKVIEIQHGSTYSTLYAHLNGFAPSIKQGTTVKQGQVIGYVGMTGLATGPHLHYEFRVNDIHKDPLTVELPNASPIHAKHKPQFLAHVSDVLEQLSNYQNIALAEVKLNPNTKQGA